MNFFTFGFGHEEINEFSGKCRQYIAFINDAKPKEDPAPQLAYESIEHFQRAFKCHRNILEQKKDIAKKIQDKTKN